MHSSFSRARSVSGTLRRTPLCLGSPLMMFASFVPFFTLRANLLAGSTAAASYLSHLVVRPSLPLPRSHCCSAAPRRQARARPNTPRGRAGAKRRPSRRRRALCVPLAAWHRALCAMAAPPLDSECPTVRAAAPSQRARSLSPILSYHIVTGGVPQSAKLVQLAPTIHSSST